MSVKVVNGYNPPAPDAVYDLCRTFGCQPENAVVIGYTIADVGMANASGAKSVAVLWGAHSQELLQTHNPTRMVGVVNSLPPSVRGVFA